MLLFLSHIHTYTGVHFPFNIQALYKTGKNSFLTTGYRAAVECCILWYELCSQETETKHEYGKEKKNNPPQTSLFFIALANVMLGWAVSVWKQTAVETTSRHRYQSGPWRVCRVLLVFCADWNFVRTETCFVVT